MFLIVSLLQGEESGSSSLDFDEDEEMGRSNGANHSRDTNISTIRYKYNTLTE